MNSFLTEKELSAIGFKRLGKNVKLSRNAAIYGAGRIEIGDNSRIDDFCILSAGTGGIKIGKFVHIACHTTLIGKEKITVDDLSTISGHCSIYSSSDDFSGEFLVNPTIPDKYRNVTNGKVIIGSNVIVGCNSSIMPGITLNDGCAVGAHSLVTKDIKENMLAVGAPARAIKKRKGDYKKLETKFLKEAGY